jgi:copper chaperone CopZ
MLVDMTVSELDGVESSESDSAAGSTVVAFDTDKIDAETIAGAIRSVGYEAQLAE